MTNVVPPRSPSSKFLRREYIFQRGFVPAGPPLQAGRILPAKYAGKREMLRGPARTRVEKPHSVNKKSRLQHDVTSSQRRSIASQAQAPTRYHLPSLDPSPSSKKRIASRELLRRRVLMSQYSARLASENEAMEERIAAMEGRYIQLLRQVESNDRFSTDSNNPSQFGQKRGLVSQLHIVFGIERLWSNMVDKFREDAPAPLIYRKGPYRPGRRGQYKAAYLRSIATTSPLHG